MTARTIIAAWIAATVAGGLFSVALALAAVSAIVR